MSMFTVVEEQGVAVVSIDQPGSPVNLLSAAATAEFTPLLERLRTSEAVRAVVLISGKPDSFIAGADIEEFVALPDQAAAEALSRGGQAIMNRVAEFPKPIVAAIHGTCLGGGLELALACRYRIATNHPKTQLGLPEIQLGILPGAGGCQRLPRLIGVRAALDIILAGKSERAAKAFRLGIVDELVPPPLLRSVALAAAVRLMTSGPARRPRRGGVAGFLLDGNPLGRALVYRMARKSVLAKTGGHYPAPLSALEAVRTGMEHGMKAGLDDEHRRFGALAVSAVSRKLVQIFFATTALKKDDGVAPGTATPRPVRRIGIVGSGFMGSSIAGTAVAQAGVEVRMKDADLARVGKGLKAAIGILDSRLKRRRITRQEYQRLSALLSGTADFTGFPRADLVVEAVFEELAVKRTVVAELEATLGAEALIATNPSTIPITDIAEGAHHPGRVLGMHFFSPVDRMPLLEVIPGAATTPDAIATAVQFGRRMGKTVIVVADRPGFWVNRILSPYLNEAGHLLREGTPIEALDRTMTRFGFPVGPIALLDEVGLDVAGKGGGVMHQAFGDRLAPAPVIGRMLADNRLGRKNGRGFYRYEGGKKAGVDAQVYRLLGITPSDRVSPQTIEQRLVYAMLNEAAAAAGEGVVRSPRDGDIGAIFGIGFPPFRGGPLRLIDDLGAAQVVSTLRALETEFGPRFAPAPPLVAMAEQGGRYYDQAGGPRAG
jgi:3-hydroxyacyl-CoA dehydrogenase/enoyl-CoA hydratase/3-hydroxybutyryl-CoA epimerase